MAVKVEVVDATLAHVRTLARTMRTEDRDEIEGLGLIPRHVLNRLWRESAYRRAGLVDGEVAAMWGVEGQLLAPVAFPWMFTSAAVERVPFQFFSTGARELASMLEIRCRLQTEVAASYTKAIRTFRLMGFRIGEPRPRGPYGKMFCQMIVERPNGP